MVLEALIEKELTETAPHERMASRGRLIASPSDPTASPVDDDLEKLLIWAQAKYGNEEFISAKEEFFWKTGKVFHDDPFYEERMSYFLDYFLLQRSISLEGKMETPFETYQRVAFSGDVIPTPIITGFVHSIFQIAKVTEDKLLVDDMISGQRHCVCARPLENFKALNRKDIFQGFLYLTPTDSQYFLSHGIIFHPGKAVRMIRKNVRRMRKQEDFSADRELSTLCRKQLKYLRHAHVDPRRIYTELEG